MDGTLLVELDGQMLQSLQTPDLAEDPLLVAFLCSFQIVPRFVDVLRANSKNYCRAETPNTVKHLIRAEKCERGGVKLL